MRNFQNPLFSQGLLLATATHTRGMRTIMSTTMGTTMGMAMKVAKVAKRNDSSLLREDQNPECMARISREF